MMKKKTYHMLTTASDASASANDYIGKIIIQINK